MQKLDWLPLYIDELLSSPAYMDMTDSQFGWYMKLLLRSTRSERLGYLPLDGQLWRLAGARSREFFDRENSRVMACFKIRQFDGLEWIYNQKLLSVMEDQSNKYRKKSSLISPVISEVELGKSTSKAKSEPIPAGLHALEYARGLCESIGLPCKGNLEVIADAVTAVAQKQQVSGHEAYTFLTEKAGEAVLRGEVVNRWWFQDAKWRRNGEQPSKAKQRQQSNREGLEAAIRNRYGTDGGPGSSADGEGIDLRGERGLGRTIGKGAGASD